MGVFHDRSALLIIDMINDFAKPDGRLYVKGIEKIIPVISSLAGEARSLGRPVIYICDAHDVDDVEFQRWGPHALAGTTGSEVIDELKPRETDITIPKKRFSAFFNTDLEKVLEDHEIDHVVLTGTVTNICVFATALDAVMRDYRVTVVEGAVHGIDEVDHLSSLKQLEKVFGVEVVRAQGGKNCLSR